MTYKTHILGGILAGLMASKGENIDTVVIVTGISAISSLIPDIDIPNSKIGNKAGIISKGINKAFGHRGLFHSPVLYLVIGFLLRNTIPFSILLGVLVGIGSHLILDMFNSTGIPVLYPLSRSKISFAKIKTRSTGENIFAIFLIIAIIFVSYTIITNQSYSELIVSIKNMIV